MLLPSNFKRIPFIHETYPGNVPDSEEFSGIVDKIITRLTELNICSEDLVLVFDKGNNSKDNIKKVASKMSFVGAVKANQAEELLDVPLSKYECLYKNRKVTKSLDTGQNTSSTEQNLQL